MMPTVQLEHRRHALSAEEQDIIKKEQWIDDETDRLLQRFPAYLSGFRHWRQDAEVRACCEQAEAEVAYRDFIWKLAYGQAQRNYAHVRAVERIHLPNRSAGCYSGFNKPGVISQYGEDNHE